MRLKNKFWKIAVMLIAIPFCISCGDDDDVTVSNKFYLSTNVYPADSYEASLSLILKDNSVVINSLESEYRFVACSTSRVSGDVVINVTNDDELVKAYNEANDTEYNPLPVANYSFINSKVTIHNGESISTDSISIALKDVESLTAEGGYLLPIKIASIDKGTMNDISSNRGVVYVKVDNTHVNVESGQPETGTMIANRSEWLLKVSSTTRGDVNNLIDGNSYSDVARDGGNEYWLTVDLGKVKTLTGIRNICYGSGYSPTAVEVSSSQDGLKWKSMGTVTLSRARTQYIKFVNDVQTRYLKYYIVAGASTVSLTEFDLFEK